MDHWLNPVVFFLCSKLPQFHSHGAAALFEKREPGGQGKSQGPFLPYWYPPRRMGQTHAISTTLMKQAVRHGATEKAALSPLQYHMKRAP